jgi:hypothetical protein
MKDNEKILNYKPTPTQEDSRRDERDSHLKEGPTCHRAGPTGPTPRSATQPGLTWQLPSHVGSPPP